MITINIMQNNRDRQYKIMTNMHFVLFVRSTHHVVKLNVITAVYSIKEHPTKDYLNKEDGVLEVTYYLNLNQISVIPHQQKKTY